jgi:hydroxyethylthiazole kinase-like uncharacterized protein yjeF
MVRHCGLSEIGLMEQAASACCAAFMNLVERQYSDLQRIVVVCGNGNNGGDGFCIARMLAANFQVSVVWSGHVQDLKPCAAHNFHRLPASVEKMNICDTDVLDADIIIDAVLGVGTTLPLREPADRLINIIARSHIPVVSIDMPSGLTATTGEHGPCIVNADHTITMQAPKTGMICGAGPALCGIVYVIDIGIPADVLTATCQNVEMSQTDVRDYLQTRAANSSKFDFGRVAVIGGTYSMRGAPSLAAEAAIALGAGIVDLISPSTHPFTPREIIAHEVASHPDGTISSEAVDDLVELLSRATTVAVGPGLGSNPATLEMISYCIGRLSEDVPVIIDADALRAAATILPRSNTVITPHMGEFGRLLNRPRAELETSYVEHAQVFARENGCIVHLKNVPSVTTNGHHTTYLGRGTPAMSTAGAGDVLTGIIASFAAQGLTVYDATRLGAYVHACAGECIQHSTGYRSLLAHELIKAARMVIAIT